MNLSDLVVELTRLQADQGPDVRIRVSTPTGDFEISHTLGEILNANTLWLITGPPVRKDADGHPVR